jgi:hypothetical protein
MIARDAAIYIALFFLPLTFVAMIWPATSRWARRLVELLVAVVFAKFVILSIITLATGAITSTALAEAGESNVFERMVAGSALLVLAAWSPFALLRLIPMMEVAAASVTSQRAAMTSAAGSAGIQSPAAYVRQAMDSHARASASPRSSGAPLTLYAGGATGGGPGGGAGASGARPAERETGAADVRAEAASGGSPRATYPPASRGGRPTGSGESDVETGKERVGEERPADSPSSPPSESGSRRGPPPDRPASPQPPREEE